MREDNAILYISIFLFARNRLLFLQSKPSLAKKILREEENRAIYLKKIQGMVDV
jgi:hypothetical protein